MNNLALETATHHIELNCLQPSLVLMIGVKSDEICADILPRSRVLIGLP
jgi:hypothetical protein